MSKLSSSQPFSNDYWENHNLSAETNSLYEKSRYIVDTSDAFYDPFSDLNIFLSKAIKTEIQKHGTIRNWSQQIQTTLLKNILPDFSKSFPNYRLGGVALKKVWDKVTYYYRSARNKQGALQEDGSLNVEVMIRENLKSKTLHHLPSHHPPCYTAQKLAMKIGECVAILDGKRLNIEELTKKIWLTQRHLIAQSTSTADNPYETLDNSDKLIVQYALEILAQNPSIDASLLSKHILKKFSQLRAVESVLKTGKLQSLLSAYLSAYFIEKLPLWHLLSSKEKFSLVQYIKRQLQYHLSMHDLSLDNAFADVVQKILTFYPIASNLQKQLTKEQIVEGVRHLLAVKNKAKIVSCKTLPQSVQLFLNTEIHLLQDHITDPQELENAIAEAYLKAQSLPSISYENTKGLEVIIWKTIKDIFSLAAPEEALSYIEETIGNGFIDYPLDNFATLKQRLFLFFQSSIKTLHLAELESRISNWSMQHDLIHAMLHFDQKSPIFSVLAAYSNNYPKMEKEALLDKAQETLIQQNPPLQQFAQLLRIRLNILYKTLFYTKVNKKPCSNFAKFIAWNKKYVTTDLNALKERVHRQLPLIPTTLIE